MDGALQVSIPVSYRDVKNLLILSRPRKPKHRNRKSNASNHREWQAVLWSRIFHFHLATIYPSLTNLRVDQDYTAAHQGTNDGAN